MINNRNINDDIGSDGSTPQDRANAAGFRGKAAETVAINPVISISSLDDMAIIRDCANTDGPNVELLGQNARDFTQQVDVRQRERR